MSQRPTTEVPLRRPGGARAAVTCAVALAAVISGCGTREPSRSPKTPSWVRAEDPLTAIAPPPPWILGHAMRHCHRSSPTTEVDADPDSETALAYPWSGRFGDGLGPVALAPWGPTLTRFVVADRGNGIRVFDASAPDGSAHVTASMELPARPLGLHAAGEHALLVLSAADGDHALWWLKLSRAAPALVAKSLQLGELRGMHVLHRDENKLRIVLVVDAFAAGPCSDRSGTLLRVVELQGDQIALRQELDLGPGVQRILRSGAWFAVQDNLDGDGYEHGLGVRFVDLSAELLKVSKRRATGHLHAFHAEGNTLHFVHSERSTLPPPRERATSERFSIEELHVTPELALAQTRRCSLDNEVALEEPGYYPIPPLLTDTLFLRDRVLLAFSNVGTGAPNVRELKLTTCESKSFSLDGARFVMTPAQDALLGLAPHESSTLDVYLHDLERLGAQPMAVHVELAYPDAASRHNPILSNNYWLHEARVHTFGAAQRLSVPFYAYDASGNHRRGTQFFEVEKSSLRASATSEGELWLTRPDGSAVFRSRSGLRLTKPQVQRDLWPLHVTAKLLPKSLAPQTARSDRPRNRETPPAIARIRYPSVPSHFDAHARALSARLELVPGDRDPQSGAADASFGVHGHARLDSVGSLLVASSQALSQEGNTKVQPCHFEVFDVASLEHASRLALHVDATLCDDDHKLVDQPAFSTQRALVFARPEHRYNGPHEVTRSRRAFFVLDLSSPKAPVMRGPFRTSEDEYALAAFSDGTHVVYGFRIPAPTSDPLRPSARYYVRRVDFSDPTAPRFEEPLSVPGELIALDGDTLYVREASWHGETARYTVHRLKVHAGKAEVVASGLDEQAVHARHREPSLTADEEVVDFSAAELLVIRAGALRRVARGQSGP